ncbi:MAG: superfamily II DNA/RNA helicase [Paraglaciecola psychrophila]|jgi:superfamily II DNA/RNA helicase
MPKTTFADLKLDNRLLKSLAGLKYDQPTDVQRATIPRVLAGKDLLVSTATGSGKTSAYLLPALQRLLTDKGPAEGTRTLILAPTRELAQQIIKYCDKLTRFNHLKSGLLSGGSDFKYQAAMLRKDPEILVATPGRLLEHINKGNVLLAGLEMLIVDEADRMLDMGLSEDVLRICDKCAAACQTLMFSATLSSDAVNIVAGKILNKPERIVQGNRRGQSDSVTQQVVLADNDSHKVKLLQWLLAQEQHSKAIIFSNTRRQADRICEQLQGDTQRVNVLHSEIRQDQRNETMAMFRQGAVKLLVATDVAARGLDISQVDLVINYSLPDNADDYVHRVGRTGRAGKSGLAISLVDESQWSTLLKLERYLKNTLERRKISSLKGHFQGREEAPPPPKKPYPAMTTAPSELPVSSSVVAKNAAPTKDKKPFSTKKSKKMAPLDGFAPFKKKQ